MAKRRIIETTVAVATLDQGRAYHVDVQLSDAALADGAVRLGVIALEKVRLAGRLLPQGKRDWRFDGKIGATVTQACVATLDQVRTRLDQRVSRSYLARWEEPAADSVIEMDPDTDTDPLGDTIDLGALALEAVSLAMPDYPRRDDAEAADMSVAAPGIDPLSDADLKPFAALKALREKLEK